MSICKLFIPTPLRWLQLDHPGSCHETMEKVGRRRRTGREDVFEFALYQAYTPKDLYFISMLKCLQWAGHVGSQAGVWPAARLKMSRRYIGSLDALHCSQGARVDIFFKFGNWTENIELLLLKCTHVDSGNCMKLVSDSKRHDSPTLFENSYWVVSVIPNIENWN